MPDTIAQLRPQRDGLRKLCMSPPPREASESAPDLKSNLEPWERRLSHGLVIALSMVIATILGVSLQHLAWGIQTVTGTMTWSSWALATAVDIGMVASEITLIVLARRPDIGVTPFARRYVIATLAISMALNVLAFWPERITVIAAGLAIALGCGMPAGVYHLTRVAGKVWLVTRSS